MGMGMAEGAPYWMLWDELVVGGAHWSGLLRRGTTLRLTDVAGGGNVSALFYNYEDRLERYNMADTLKAQHTAYLTRACVCYSDMGRVMCSITDDTCGWHDTLCGVTNASMVSSKYGDAPYQQRRNEYHRNAYDGFLNELGKYGLGKRDLAANINFFSKVTADDDGNLKFHVGNSVAGSYIDLRFEMNTLVVLAACQHPLDPATGYRPKEVRLTTWHSRPAPRNDLCRTRCPENERGFRNTEVWYR
ncbi:urea amidolyase associated protein UAAP1 [Steroidobacter agaridevorans]|uniref:urea amidolyase associated protein UAAP1 n=1 Tax=Steroidobacter agaridevorans TaxID=2695856 RepID=UPI001324FDBD|nr:urea amidolyase associated protein UAAP1 [Steroidobacter agaridevorans]GFE90966.1 urea carboxylase [Steroidobacter agaridevorans]